MKVPVRPVGPGAGVEQGRKGEVLGAMLARFYCHSLCTARGAMLARLYCHSLCTARS